MLALCKLWALANLTLLWGSQGQTAASKYKSTREACELAQINEQHGNLKAREGGCSENGNHARPECVGPFEAAPYTV